MFDAPLEAWYVWIGLAVAGGAAVGVAGSMPAAPPPDAAGAARTVDGVAASPHAAVGSHPLPNAAAVRVGRDGLALRGPGGTERAPLGYGPVTPAAGDGLAAVLRGEPPGRAFDSPADFRRAARAARAADPEWRATERLLVRRVSWEGVDVVLVG